MCFSPPIINYNHIDVSNDRPINSKLIDELIELHGYANYSEFRKILEKLYNRMLENEEKRILVRCVLDYDVSLKRKKWQRK